MARKLTKLKILEVSSVDRGAGEGVDVVLLKREDPDMPWTAGDAQGHTKKADTPKKQHRWATVANAALADGKDEGSAVRIANAAIAKMLDSEDSDNEAANEPGDEPYWKREFSQEERDRDAKSGAAMSDGSFPIHNAKDLRNAMHLAGHSKHPDAARAHIKSRAKALGLESQLSDAYKREGTMSGKIVDSLAKARAAFVASVKSIFADEMTSAAKKQLLLDTTSEQLVDHITDDIVKSLSEGNSGEPPEDDMSPEVKKALGLPDSATEQDVIAAVTKLAKSEQDGKDAEITKLKKEAAEAQAALAVAKAGFAPEELNFYNNLADQPAKDAFVKADHAGRMTQMEKREPELLELAKKVAENEALRKRLERLEEDKALAEYTKRAIAMGLPESKGRSWMLICKNAKTPEEKAAVAEYEKDMTSAINAAKEGGLFKEFGATGQIGPISALDELTAKAAELRKINPKLTKEQAFAKVYSDPENIKLAQKERQESYESARATR